MRRPLPISVRRPVFSLLGRVYPKADWAPRAFRAKTTFQALARDSVQAYFHSMSILRDDMRRALYSSALKAELAGYNAIEVFERYAPRANAEDPLALVQYLDLKTYLVGDINTKVDRASMAHSLEVREPLMDHPLVEWLATLPSSMKLKGGEGKHAFKRAMEPFLPRDVLYRQKMGFAVPLAEWFRGPLRARVRGALLDGRLADTGFFDLRSLRRLVDQHQSGARDHSAPLWSLLMFDAFLRVSQRGSARESVRESVVTLAG
jgi:asparagine synthase (glutamine-hydrolysing)